MSYYVYDGSGLSAVCSSVMSFCLHACKLWYGENMKKDSVYVCRNHTCTDKCLYLC